MRACGECVACCVWHSVEELDKPPMRHCPHMLSDEAEIPGQSVCYSGGGCGIKADPKRPAICESYQCEWLLGAGDDADRPDRSGVIADRLKEIGNAVECKPLWDGAAEAPDGQRAIERIARDKDMVALVISFYGRQLVRAVGRTS